MEVLARFCNSGLTFYKTYVYTVKKSEIISQIPKIKTVLHDVGLIDAVFSGQICIEINKGGISKLKRIEEIK